MPNWRRPARFDGNAFKVELAKRTIVAVLAQLTGADGMSKLQNAIVGGVRAAMGYVPGSWLPGGTPDPLIDKRVNLGTQQSRIDGPDKVKGAARFAAEVPMEGLLYAAFVHSTIARGRIAELDVAAAEAADGVALVMTHRNAPEMALPPPLGLTNLKAAGNNILPVMQDAGIRWNGADGWPSCSPRRRSRRTSPRRWSSSAMNRSLRGRISRPARRMPARRIR